MNTDMPQIKIRSLDFIIFLFMTLFIGKGSFVVAATDYHVNPIGMGLLALSIIYLFAAKTNNKLSPHVKPLVLVLFVWVIVHLYVIDYSYTPFFYVGLIVYFLGGLAIAKHYGFDMVYYYEKSMYVLALISLPLWALQMAGGTSFLNSLPFVLRNTAGTSDYSLLLYTINGQPSVEWYGNVIRNCGCAWEPGLFATMLTLALVFRMFINKGKLILKDRHNIVLLLALITTFSTTGYITLFLLMGLHILITSRMGIGRKIVYGIIGLGVFSWVYSFSFMSDKIEARSDFSEFVTETGKYNQMEETFTVDRFEGIALDYANMLDAPLLGYGMNRNFSYVANTISPLILTSNSITKPLAQMGIPLGAFLFVLLFLSIKKISSYYNNTFLILLMCLFISAMSYNMFENPIIRALQFLFLIIPSYSLDGRSNNFEHK